MDDALLAALHCAFDQHQARSHDRAPQPVEMPSPEQCIHDPRLVLDGDEDGIALAGALPDQHHPRGAHIRAVFRRIGLGTAEHTLFAKPFAQEGHGMRFERQACRLVIGNDMIRQRHRRQRRIAFLQQFTALCSGKERQLVPWHAPHIPQCLPAVLPDRAKSVCIGQQPHGATREIGPPRQVFYAGKGGSVARRRKTQSPFLTKTVELAQADPQGEHAVPALLKRIIPCAGIDIGSTHLPPMLAQVAHQLRRGIEPHGL